MVDYGWLTMEDRQWKVDNGRLTIDGTAVGTTVGTLLGTIANWMT